MNNNPDETEVKNGVALIINNEFFFNELTGREYENDKRNGSKEDVNKLSKLLQEYGFTVRPSVIDCTEKEIKREVEKLAKEIMGKENYDLVLLVVMTHGDDGGTLYDKYLNVYNVKDIWDPFLPIKNIPKVFIRQTCRGGKYDMGQKVSTTQSQEMDSQRPNLESQTSTQEYEGNLTPMRVSIIPNVHDVLVAYATIEDYYSWRHPLDGTYFITSFVKAVTENETNGKVELTGVFKSTARLLAKQPIKYLDKYNEYKICKQTSSFVSSFTKKYFLVKPSALPNNEMATMLTSDNYIDQN